MKVTVECGICFRKIGEENIPYSLYQAMEERKQDYKQGLISRDLYLYEMSACLNNKIA